MDIVTLLQALPDVIFTSDFVMACVLVFFLCEALFTIPFLGDLKWGKPLIALVVGAVIGVVKWGVSPDAVILGVIAGGITTLAVARLDWWFSAKKKK